MLSQVDALFFDLDGTLVDSVPDLAVAINQMLDTLGLPTRSEAQVRTWVGNGMDNLIRRALVGDMDASQADPALFARARPLYKAAYAAHLSAYSCLYPGVREGLATLREAGFAMACVTNKAAEFAEPLLERLDIGAFFATVVGGDCTANPKPAPDALWLCAERLGVPAEYASFAVPLGATTKMDGCAAIYPAVAAIFVAQFYNVPLAVSDYFLIVFVSVIGSAATAGLTGAVVMLTLTLSTLGLPLEGVGLLLAVDPILDMGRTATNVAGQALVPTLVAKQQGMLDMDVYNAASGDLPTEPDETTQRAA